MSTTRGEGDTDFTVHFAGFSYKLFAHPGERIIGHQLCQLVRSHHQHIKDSTDMGLRAEGG